MNTKRFRVALSFAGEKRDFVEKVAAILAQRFGESAVLYDKFHEAEFAVYDLGIRLPKLYGEQSDLIVPVLCPAYDAKRWTGWEWVHIYGLLTKAVGHRVMPSRFERAIADGLALTAGFIELDDKTPAQFATLILERLALNEGQPKDHYTKPVSASPPVLKTSTPNNNLPRLQFFFGREKELQFIADSLAPESRGWGVLIDGPGGIGKTALAIRAAELVPAGRFKRIIFLSSKERELTADGQRTLGNFVLPGYLDMLNAIARELNQPDLAKSPEVERADAINRALRDSGVLLVLDNLETLPEQDRDLLFAFLNRLPRGCSAITTSRRRADASALAVRVDKLDWPAARDLIAEIAKDNDRLRNTTELQRRALHEATGGNPLLIRWVAGQLGLGRCRTLISALDFLRSAPAGNNPLEFIFGDLLGTFSDNETKVVAALTHFTTPMEAQFIAELGAVGATAAQTALESLAYRALVVPDAEERNFVLVPMVADFLRKARPEAVKETGNRLEKHAYALIIENGKWKHHRFPVLEKNWPVIAAATPIILNGPNARLQDATDALSDFLNFTGRWDERISLNREAETRAVADKDYHQAGWRAYHEGYVHYVRRDSSAALGCANRAESHWLKAEAGALEISKAIRLRGLGHYLAGDFLAAIEAHKQSIEHCQHHSNRSPHIAILLKDLADAERRAGDLDAAERDGVQARQLAIEIDYRQGMAASTGSLAEVALDRSDWLHAYDLAHEALVLSKELGRLELIAKNCRRVAKAFAGQGKKAEGLPYARHAVDIYAKLGSPDLKEAQETLAECEG